MKSTTTLGNEPPGSLSRDNKQHVMEVIPDRKGTGIALYGGTFSGEYKNTM